LPSTDDFRTSLLMPNLSARFSMLREQDDPRSLLGKASDDSVLQPRRRSRMDFGGLGDIAEVDASSIRSQKICPPFAFERQDSFASEDGYASENDSSQNGSVMSRARPGEGNILFGGRQKVYMIPKAGSTSTRSLGKQVYEDDIGRSAFQKYRKEREAVMGRSSDESQNFDFGLDQTTAGAHDDHAVSTHDDRSRDLAHSPSLSSSERKRSTNSTSHSEARSSTAATSVASQPATAAPSPAVAPTQPPAPAPSTFSNLKRADTKTRRLYEQGLDQHMYEQQTSALSRLNSIQRQRTHTNGKQSPPVLQSTKSASNLHDKARQPVYALRAQSPETVSPPLTSFGAIRIPQPSGASPSPSGPVSPVEPMDFDENNALNRALEPGDRGKATAMGAFNKPKQSFDEQQYMERQRQLQRTTSSAASKKELAGPTAFQQRMGHVERERSDSNGSARSGSGSAPKKHEPPTAYNVFQRAAQMNTQGGVQQFDKSSLPDTHRTFFGNISASDSEEEEEDQSRFNHPALSSPDYGYGTPHGRWHPTALPSVSEHPALRSHRSKPSLPEVDEDVEPMPQLNTQSTNSPGKDHTTQIRVLEDVESPTLGLGASTTPLNGLMHHLRQQSNVSSNPSVFPGDDRPSLSEPRESQVWNPKNLDLVNGPLRNTVDSDSPYASSNPFDLEEMSTFRGSERADGRASRASISPIEGPRPSAQFDSRAPSRSTFLNRQSEVSDLEPEGETEPSWQAEMQSRHTRDASTATQQEREAFARELADRQKAIRENMKSMVETQSRETSPAPSNARRTFGMLRSRPSGESIENVPRAHAPPKAMKMLGLSGPPPSSSSNTLNSQYERGGYSLDIGRPRDDSASRPPMPNMQSRPSFQQGERGMKSEWQPSRSRENSESRPTRPSPASSAGGRSRANSEVASGRSRSRTGPYRDDLEKAMIEGTGSSAAGVPELSPMVPRELTPRPSPDVIQHPFEAPRMRSNSRGGMSNYFDQKALQPIQTNSKDRLTPGAPSPAATLSPNVYSPAASVSGRPSPTIPFAHNMTPPLSGTNTPLSGTFTPPPQIPPQLPPSSGRPNGVLRKKTISKGDISEPTLISSTSNIDTIDLPEGASLKNGMDEPPPLPPINPRRRAGKGLFGLGGRKESEESVPYYGSRSKTPDMLSSRPYADSDFPLEAPPRGPRSVSQTRSPRMPKQSFDQMRSHTMPLSTGSPERGARSPVPPVAFEGGMF
jgi:hypothetical protein